MSDERRTAVHEAAHAIVAHHLGVDVVGITIVPDGTTLGCCPISYTAKLKPSWVEQAAIYLAGHIVETLVYDICFGGCESDLNEAYRLTHCKPNIQANKRSVWTTTRYYDEAYQISEEIITAQLSAIDRLADLLMRRRAMHDATEIYDIIAELSA